MAFHETDHKCIDLMYKINTFVLILYSSEKITIKNKSVF